LGLKLRSRLLKVGVKRGFEKGKGKMRIPSTPKKRNGKLKRKAW